MPNLDALPRDLSGSSLRRRILRGLVLFSVSILSSAALLWFMAPTLGFAVISADRHATKLVEAAPVESPIDLPATEARPRNVIVFVADGLGFAHLSLARAALHGIDGPAVWDRFHFTGWHRPHPELGFLTDSAASATALATGQATNNGAVGVDADGRPLLTLFERADELGYSTGIVTDSYIWDATPAAFAAHCADRDEAATILRQLAASSLDVLIGELEDVGEEEVPEWAPSVAILEQRFRVFGPSATALGELSQVADAVPVAAIFEEDQVDDLSSIPDLPTLTETALDRLASGERPFLLLVESEEPDSASHRNDLERLLRGMEAIESTLTLLLDFVDRNGETLLLFTSDHETGGLVLSVEGTNSQLRALWATIGHSGVAVPVMALGPGAKHFSGIHTNAEIGRLLEQMLRHPHAGQSELSETPASRG